MEPNTSTNLFKQRRSYNPITDPIEKEKVRLRNLKWNTENPTRKHEGQKRWRDANKDYNMEYFNRKHIEKFGVSKPEITTNNISKFEQSWKDLLEREFPDLSFVKIRPEWLKNPSTGYNLELDFYNEKLSLGVEVSGEQHFKFTPIFHKTLADFENQQKRDRTKQRLCDAHNVHLIIITKHDDVNTKLEEIRKYVQHKTIELIELWET